MMEQTTVEQTPLKLDEQESNFTIEATDRKTVKVFSNDPVWQKRLAKLGIEPRLTSGYGCFYDVDLTQFSFAIRKRRQMTDEQRRAIGERLAAYRDSGEIEDEDDAD